LDARPNNGSPEDELNVHLAYWPEMHNWELNDESSEHSDPFVCEYGKYFYLFL